MDNKDIHDVEGAINGNTVSLENLINVKMKEILYISLYFSNIDDYEDIAQEACINIVTNITKLKEARFFDTWMYKVIKNTSYDYFKKKNNREKRNIYDESIENKIVETAIEKLPKEYTANMERNDMLMHAILQLSDKYKEVLILRYYKGLKYQEIAELLNISQKTVENYLRRGKVQLREILDDNSRMIDTNIIAPLGLSKLLPDVFHEEATKLDATDAFIAETKQKIEKVQKDAKKKNITLEIK